MSKHRQARNKQMAGCGWQLIIIPLVFALLYFGNDAPVANPGMAVHPLVVVGIIGGGLWFLFQMVTGKGGGTQDNVDWLERTLGVQP